MDSKRLIKELKEKIIKNDLMVKTLIKVRISLLLNILILMKFNLFYN